MCFDSLNRIIVQLDSFQGSSHEKHTFNGTNHGIILVSGDTQPQWPILRPKSKKTLSYTWPRERIVTTLPWWRAHGDFTTTMVLWYYRKRVVLDNIIILVLWWTKHWTRF